MSTSASGRVRRSATNLRLISGRSRRQACRSQLGTLGRCDLVRSARLGADHEHDGVVRQRDGRPDRFHVEGAHKGACRCVNVLTVHLKTRVSCVDEVQLLVLLVGGIRVVVLADEAIACIPSGVGVDSERGDPEVIADRRPLRIAVSVVGGWDVGQRGVRSGHGGDSSGTLRHAQTTVAHGEALARRAMIGP